MYKNRVVVVVVFAIISFFIFRHCTTVGASVVEAISSCILYPLLRVQQLVVEPITNWLGRSVSIKELENTVAMLKKNYDDILAENIALKAMNHYADETKELRDFNKRYVLSCGHVVQILARHFSPNNQFFLVDAGTSQGIQKDMVALYGNAIVGRVVQVYPWYCKVCLITDADCKIAALCLPAPARPDTSSSSVVNASPARRSLGEGWVEGSLAVSSGAFSEGWSEVGSGVVKKSSGVKKGASGIHEGTNNTTHTVMRYVSHLESVNVGDDVFSSGEGLVFPKGFALGKVISADKGDLFYTITIQPALDFQALRYCTLVAKQDI